MCYFYIHIKSQNYDSDLDTVLGSWDINRGRHGP